MDKPSKTVSMASATPDLQLHSQPYGIIIAIWPLPIIYTAWWQRRTHLHNFYKVVTWQRHGRESNPRPPRLASPTTHYLACTHWWELVVENGDGNRTRHGSVRCPSLVENLLLKTAGGLRWQRDVRGLATSTTSSRATGITTPSPACSSHVYPLATRLYSSYTTGQSWTSNFDPRADS